LNYLIYRKNPNKDYNSKIKALFSKYVYIKSYWQSQFPHLISYSNDVKIRYFDSHCNIVKYIQMYNTLYKKYFTRIRRVEFVHVLKTLEVFASHTLDLKPIPSSNNFIQAKFNEK